MLNLKRRNFLVRLAALPALALPVVAVSKKVEAVPDVSLGKGFVIVNGWVLKCSDLEGIENA
ncbi:MAG: hypothetical protein ACWA44_02225 [Thiotrichales bacterium]